MKDRKECAYGLIYKSSLSFVEVISKNWMEYKEFAQVLEVPGAMVDCVTRPPHPPAYWYYMVVAKKYVEAIGGVDEEFACGICAEDDDISNRMRMSGVKPVFEHKIIGIHQNHSLRDASDPKHNFRDSLEGIALRKRNIFLMNKNLIENKFVANTDHVWGDEKVIVNFERF
jgi:GT2 family glycosyltransferase